MFNRIVPGLVVLSLAVACQPNLSGGGGAVISPSESAMPTFSLNDENEASPTFNESVAPEDFSGDISAFYFGHAT